MPNSDPTQVLLVFFKKHSPSEDTLEHVQEVLAEYQTRADHGDWVEQMYADMSKTVKNTRCVAEHINMQATAALAATRAAAAHKGWATIKGGMVHASKRLVLAARIAGESAATQKRIKLTAHLQPGEVNEPDQTNRNRTQWQQRWRSRQRLCGRERPSSMRSALMSWEQRPIAKHSRGWM